MRGPDAVGAFSEEEHAGLVVHVTAQSRRPAHSHLILHLGEVVGGVIPVQRADDHVGARLLGRGVDLVEIAGVGDGPGLLRGRGD